jgi:ubiquinone/menaquinone biosynthesis C-methylase UbiE
MLKKILGRLGAEFDETPGAAIETSTPARKPSILVGIPCYGNVPPEVLEDYMRFFYHLGRRMQDYDFYLGVKPKTEQFRARNLMVEEALKLGVDYLLMLDDDHIIDWLVDAGVAGVGSASYDFLRRLIEHDVDIVGGLYYQRQGECAPVAMKRVGETGGYRFLRPEEIEGRLQRVDVAGGGCLLIKTRVLDKIPHPVFKPEFEYGTDIQVCKAAAEKGFSVYLDSSFEIGHIRDERAVVTSQNRLQYMVDAVPGELRRTFVTSDIYDRLIADACEWTGFRDLDDLSRHCAMFLRERENWQGTDAEWYRQYPKERVARQVWFNVLNGNKRKMTEFIISTVDHSRPKPILDFGCGIGIPAFSFAERGHRVTACDIGGTGTFEFLKWRAKKHGLDICFHDSRGGVPHLGGAEYDVIVAMDTLEHIPEWQTVLRELARVMKPMGALFSNNAILDDQIHPEHYSLDNKDFIEECLKNGLMPFNQITYVKREKLEHDQNVGPAMISAAV